jgi:hypothetical protein
MRSIQPELEKRVRRQNGSMGEQTDFERKLKGITPHQK